MSSRRKLILSKQYARLKKLCRKYSKVVEKISIAEKHLKVKDLEKGDIQVFVSPSIVALEMIRHEESVLCALGVFNILLNDVIERGTDMISRMTHCVSSLVNSKHEIIKIKVLQLLLCVVNNPKSVLNSVIFSKIFSVCFELLNSKSLTLNNTAIVVVKQTIDSVFRNTEYKKIGFLVLQDLCRMVKCESCKFLTKSSYRNPQFCFESIETIVRKNKKFMVSDTDFLFILKDQVIPIIQQSLDTNKTVYKLCSSILTMAFVKELSYDCLQIVKSLCRSLSDKHKVKKILSLEVLRRFSCNHELFIKENDNKSKKDVISLILEFVCGSILKHKLNLSSFDYSSFKFKRLDEQGLEGLKLEESLTVSIDIIIGLISTLHLLKKNVIIKDIISQTWSLVLECCDYLLSKFSKPDAIQKVLQIYNLFMVNCCSFPELSIVRDAYISSLLFYLNNLKSLESAKVNLIIQAVFDICKNCGNSLGISSWFIILKNLFELEKLLNSIKTKSTGILKKVTFIRNRLDNLFRTSNIHNFEMKSLTALLKSVLGLSKDNITKKNTFFAQKLFQILESNVCRIEKIFDCCSTLLLDHFKLLINCKFKKEFGIIKIFDLMSVIFSESNKKHVIIEKQLFELLNELNEYSNEIDQKMIELFPTLIEKIGDNLTVSWKFILKVLRTKNAKNIKKAFNENVKIIGNNYLHTLSKENLKEFIVTIEFFALQTLTNEINLSLISIGYYFTVADYLTTSETLSLLEKEEVYFFLLKRFMSLNTSYMSKKRNASIKYFFDVISPIDLFQKKETYQSFFGEILFPTISGILGLSEDELREGEKVEKSYGYEKKRNSEKNQWNLSLYLSIEGSSKFIQRNYEYFNTLTDFIKESIGKIFKFYETSLVQGNSLELMKISVLSIVAMLKNKKLSNKVKAFLWECSWKIWDVISNFPLIEDSIINKLVLGVTAILGSETNSKRLFMKDDKSVKRFLVILRNLVKRIPFKKNFVELLYVISKISNDSNRMIFDVFIETLLPNSNAIYKHLNEKKKKSRKVFVDKEIEMILKTFVEKIFGESMARKDLFIKIIRSLGAFSLTKYVRSDQKLDKLWTSSLKYLHSVISSSLGMFVDDKNTTLWNIVCLTIENYLFVYYDSSSKISLEKKEEIGLLDLIQLVLIKNYSCLSKDNRDYLISILENSTHFPEREELCKRGLSTLFDLTNAKKHNNQELSKIILSKVLKRTHQILSQYLENEKEKLVGKKNKRMEVINIFKELKLLKSGLMEENKSKLLLGERGVLFHFLPLLSKFILVEDKQIRNHVKQLVDIICDHLQL